MEHIVQFGINIDDEAIKRAVLESGVKTIEAQIKREIVNQFFDARYYGDNANPKVDKLRTWAQNVVFDMLAENKDAIINQAAVILAEKMSRSTKAREAIIAKAAE